VNKYPSDIPYTLSKNDLEGRLIKINRTRDNPILVRIMEVKEDGDRLGNRTILVKHVLKNKYELTLAKYLRSVTKNEVFTTMIHQFDTSDGWKNNTEISNKDKQYTNTGKCLDRFVERTAIVVNSKEHKISTDIIHR